MYRYSNITVLIAENDAHVLNLLCRIANSYGLNVISASTISEALQHLDTDILVLDWMLNGDERSADIVLSQWVKQNGGPSVIISGNIVPGTEEEFFLLTSGAWNVLVKPLNIPAFQSCLGRYVRSVLDKHLRDKVVRLEQEIKRLKRINYLLIISLAMLAVARGIDIVPVLLRLFGMQ